MLSDGAVILFPGALGDFICFLPALCGLRRRHRDRLLLVAQPALLGLITLPHMATASIDRREIADLFADAPLAADTRRLLGGFTTVYSWTGAGNPEFARRLQIASGGEVHVYPFRGMQPGQHAAAYYAQCVGVVPDTVAAEIIAEDRDWWARFRDQHALGNRRLLVVHPGSGSRRKNWQGFDAFCRQWRARYDDAIAALYGPAEAEHRLGCPADVVVSDVSLPQVASLLRAAALYLGNDSGVSHLAAALGARGVVLFGPSDPAVWAPRAPAIHVFHVAQTCARCGPDVFCVHRLAVTSVVDALTRQRREISTSGAVPPHVAGGGTPPR